MASRRLSAVALAAALLLAAPSPELNAQDAPKASTKAPPGKKADAAPLPTIAQITERLDDLYRSSSSHSTVTMTVVNERGTRELTLEQWTKGEEEALIVIRKPAREAGTATLRTAEGLWNYAPRADRLIRVPSGLLSASWMGSHFTNDDLVRETSYEDDYTTELTWDEEEGQRQLRVVMIPKPNAPVVFTKIDYRMTADSYIPIRADYYDEGKLIRQMRFADVREADGRLIPHRMELIPVADASPGEKTVITYESMDFDAKVDDAVFTKRGLRRAARRR